jgi:hypothetical protein
MGLDIGLAVVILLAGVRGWFRGFAFQAVQLACLVGTLFLAAPVRDLARPYAREAFPSIDPPSLDKLLWWTAAVVGYVALTGAGYSLVRFHRKRAFADLEPRRGDQGAGFALGALKGAVVVAFVASSLAARSDAYLKSGGWSAQQVQTSRALALAVQHRPAEAIWQSRPVQALVTLVRREGLGETLSNPTPPGPVPAPDAHDLEPSAVQPPPIQTAQRPLALPAPEPRLDPHSERFLDDFDSAARRAGLTPDRR